MAEVSTLADDIGVKAVFGADGTATVMVGGHAAVSGTHARTLSVERGSDGLPAVKLAADSGTIDVTNDLGGKLGGRMDAASTVSGVLDDLDTFVSTFADEMNGVHQAGYDRNGDPGGDLFTYDTSSAAQSFKVDPSVLDDGKLLALAGASTAYAGDGDNLQSMIDVEESDLFDGGNRNGTEQISAIYSTVGQALSSAETDSAVHQAQAEDLQVLRDSISGVALDQEATDLMTWQAAYQASARVVSVADEMLGELMDLVR